MCFVYKHLCLWLLVIEYISNVCNTQLKNLPATYWLKVAQCGEKDHFLIEACHCPGPTTSLYYKVAVINWASERMTQTLLENLNKIHSSLPTTNKSSTLIGNHDLWRKHFSYIVKNILIYLYLYILKRLHDI